jgi:STE24 endopeptidase
LTPVDIVLTYIQNLLTRLHEFEADAFAVSLGYSAALISGLTKISAENKGNLVPDPLYSAYHYSHPPLTTRLKALEVKGEKKSE